MFQSGTFWLVLAISVAVFWALPRGMRIGFLMLASMAYLAVQTPLNAAALLGWSLLFYLLAPLAARKARSAVRVAVPVGATSPPDPSRGQGAPLSSNLAPLPGQRWVLWLLIGGIVAYLCCFKYFVPLAGAFHGTSSYLIPLGLSYFTFKFIHYAIETARGNIKDRSLVRFLCYIYLFPIFTAGPIERFDHFLANRQEAWKNEHAIEGLTRIVQGLIKAFFIAGIVLESRTVLGDLQWLEGSVLIKQIYDGKIQTQTVYWVGMIAYLHLYFNFAGYTDIAIGASRLFGLGIMENFEWPIFSPSIGVFWKRWHLSLTGWCMTYIYMPVLGKFRRPNLATYIVFLAIGLWHVTPSPLTGTPPPASPLASRTAIAWFFWHLYIASIPWIAWGLYHATGLVLFQVWSRFKRKRKWTWTDRGTWHMPWKAVAILMTFMFVSVGELITLNGMDTFTDLAHLGQKLLFINMQGPPHERHRR